MLKPADGIEGVMRGNCINTVQEAGPNACPPVVVGVGIGGTFEKAAILAKKALTRADWYTFRAFLCIKSNGRRYYWKKVNADWY